MTTKRGIKSMRCERSIDLIIADVRRNVALVLFLVFAHCSITSISSFGLTTRTIKSNRINSNQHKQQELLSRRRTIYISNNHCLYLVPPPGSGYAGPDYEINEMPDSYVPMMEYPGTMRPGRTPENMPFHDLPIGDDDPEPIPWPHFQQIEWHHRWEPPHPHPIPMEEFIEQQGRWATPEMEAEMRAGSRRASRAQRKIEEDQKRGNTLIVDDDDDDDETDNLGDELPQDLGEGIFGSLGSTDDAKIIAEATSPEMMNKERETGDQGDETGDDDDEDLLDDFLLDLGLDSLGDDEGDDENDDAIVEDAKEGSDVTEEESPSTRLTQQGLEDVVFTDEDEDDGTSNTEEANINPEVTASIDVSDDDDDDMELGLDEEDDLDDDDSMEVPLEDFGDDDNDGLDVENFFDDGGFDFDDGDGGGDFDGGFD